MYYQKVTYYQKVYPKIVFDEDCGIKFKLISILKSIL